MAPTPEHEENCGDYVTAPEESIFPERIIDILEAFANRHRPTIAYEELIPINPYDDGPIPHLPNLHTILREASGQDDLENVSEIKLKVIAHEIGLQHLCRHMPMLRELILDGSVISSLRDLGHGLKMLKVLRVNRCRLTSLDGIYGMKNLSELYAAYNAITDLTPCTTLECITLIDVKKNQLRNLSSLGFLTLCESLRHIFLEGNHNLTQYDDYRQRIKETLPKLKSLDGITFPEEEADVGSGDTPPELSVPLEERNRMVDRNVSLPPIQQSSKGKQAAVTKPDLCSLGKSDLTTKVSKLDGSRLPSPSSSSSSASSRISSARDATSSSCSYSVSFSPKVLSPRENQDNSNNGSNIKVSKVELPKI